MEIIFNKNFQPSKLFDTYWDFACKRQDIFFSRFNGDQYPWTDDPILQKYKFTNTYRAADRVSQFLIKNIIYSSTTFSPEDILFRILFFKIFNKIETWISVEKELGEISFKSFNEAKYKKILTKIVSEGSVFSAAYIIPPIKTTNFYTNKHLAYIELLNYIFKNGFSANVAKCQSLKELFFLLKSYSGFGDFLAFQFAIDINYSNLCDFSEMSFVVPGPGAIRGIQKCFQSNELDYVDVIKYVAENQEAEFLKRGLKFKNLFGRNLQLIDCQNIFCEVDKYTRVAYPKVEIKNQRFRIKQNFKPNPTPIEYFFPIKWQLSYNLKNT